MKNKSLLIAIILILLLAVGGYWYMKKKPATQSTADKKMMAEQNTGSGMMSMKDLLASGKSQTCTFSNESENGSQNGTTYMSGGKIRTDYNLSMPDGKTSTGSMINDGTYMYTWTNETNQGMKTVMTDSMNKAIEEVKQDYANNPNKYVNPDEKMDYKCSSWTSDPNKFVPPTNITFTDYSQMMKQSESSTEENSEMKQAQCGACDSIQDDNAKSMCKKSLNCE